jgi:hypothetical protein
MLTGCAISVGDLVKTEIEQFAEKHRCSLIELFGPQAPAEKPRARDGKYTEVLGKIRRFE